MKFTISYIAIFAGLCFYAQAQKQEKPPKMKKDGTIAESISYRPTEFRAGIDVLALGNSVFEKSLERIEVNADIDFYHYLLNIDLGYENDLFDESISSNSIYSIDGQYFKLGIDRSLSIDNPTNSDIFVGFRYAKAFYTDKLDYTISDELWGNNSFNPSNTATARWLEFTFGMKVSMIRNIAIGYTWRFKFARKVNGNEAFEPYKVPGFGKTIRKNNLGLNFYVLFRLPVPKSRKQLEAKSLKDIVDDTLDQ